MTAWLLTWLWQGSALAAGVAVALRCAPRRNAATRHLIWCAALAALALARLGQSSPSPGVLTPVPVRGSDPIYIPSAPDFLISIFARHLGGDRACESAARAARSSRGLRAARPLPSVSAEHRSRGFRSGSKRRRAAAVTELMICDAVPGATVLGFHRPCIAIPSSLVEALTDRRARSSDSSRARARAAAGRLVAARADAVAVGAVDSSGGAVRVARAEPRARDGVRRMGRRADRSAEGVREMPRARCRSARRG